MFEPRDVSDIYERDYEGFDFEPRDVLMERAVRPIDRRSLTGRTVPAGKATAGKGVPVGRTAAAAGRGVSAGKTAAAAGKGVSAGKPAAGKAASGKLKKSCKLNKRNGQRTKVGMGKTELVQLCSGDSIYSDDLSGCSVVLIRFPDQDGAWVVLFSHVNPGDVARIAGDIGTDVQGMGNPLLVTLLKATNAAGAELHPNENASLRTMLTGHGFNVHEQTYQPSAGRTDITAEFRYGDNSLLVV
jgi:hypothetical protein